MSRFSDEDPEYLLREQYRTDSNLRTRISIHERFGSNPISWHRWIFDQLPVETSGRTVLELGAGDGTLWRANIDRLPGDWAVTISDFSSGVLESAQGHLPTDWGFEYQVVDAQEMPFEDDSFDVVIANHMLYHVPKRAQTIENVRRVLRQGGTFYAATNGSEHLRELDGLLHDFVPGDKPDDSAEKFGLHNGAAQLYQSCDRVELRRYEDSLEIDDVEAVVEYLNSTPAVELLDRDAVGRVRHRVSEAIATKGRFRVTKDVGLFIAS